MMKPQRRYLVLGAHPDDPDIRFGGTAIQLIRAGHVVKFVSLTSGNRGHHLMTGAELAKRRNEEAQAAKEVIGLSEYQVLTENSDCELEPSLENRRKVVRIIREFKPDVVLSHRLCDYHADHRAAAQLVQDAAYLTQVPKYCPETPIPEENPVFGCVWDAFTDPRPFRPDAAVSIDEVIDEKNRMLDCQKSQFYEWLPWDKKLDLNFAAMTWEEKSRYLNENWGIRYEQAADSARQVLIETYGEKGRKVHYAESFELSPYGRKISVQEFRELLMP